VLWKQDLDPNTNDRTRLCTLEHKVLRRIYGPIQDKGTGVLDGIMKFMIYRYLNHG